MADAPVLAQTATTLAYTEGDGDKAINATITATDADSANLTTATVSITAGFSSGQDILAVVTQNGISGSYNGGTGVLTLTGSRRQRSTRPRAKRDVRQRPSPRRRPRRAPSASR